jgi:PAP2 superfamily
VAPPSNEKKQMNTALLSKVNVFTARKSSDPLYRLDPEFAVPSRTASYCPPAKWDDNLLLSSIVATGLPAKYQESRLRFINDSLVKFLPPTLKDEDEISLVVCSTELQGGDDNKAEITRQDGTTFPNFFYNSIEKELNITFNSASYRNTDILLNFCYYDADCVILRLKHHFNRRRPYQLASGANIAKMFHPGTPSYPGGHATQAYLFVAIIRLVWNGRLASMLSKVETLASEVAKNREIAGVHFPSDTTAGEVLANQLVGSFKASTTSTSWGTFNDLLEKAREEWSSFK